MLTILLALTVSATSVPNHPYLPTKPAGLQDSPGEFVLKQPLCMNDLRLDAQSNTKSYSHRFWIRYWAWTKEGSRVQVPTRAVQLREIRLARFGFEPGEFNSYRPWHDVLQERGELVQISIGNFIAYRLLRSPNEDQPDYVALIEGTPYLTVKARTIEELERKVVNSFSAYVEQTSPQPSTVPVWTAPKPLHWPGAIPHYDVYPNGYVGF